MNDGIASLNVLTYSIPIWIITGILMLRLDAISYKISKMTKEYWAAKAFGWFNIVTGILLFVGFWVVKIMY